MLLLVLALLFLHTSTSLDILIVSTDIYEYKTCQILSYIKGAVQVGESGGKWGKVMTQCKMIFQSTGWYTEDII